MCCHSVRLLIAIKDISEYSPSTSLLVPEKKIRLDQINFIVLEGKFVLNMEVTAART